MRHLSLQFHHQSTRSLTQRTLFIIEGMLHIVEKRENDLQVQPATATYEQLKSFKKETRLFSSQEYVFTGTGDSCLG